MSKRLKEIDEIINSIKSQKEYENEMKLKVEDLIKKFSDKLNGYKFVSSLDELYKLKPSGYIRYINFNDEIKFGGILIKIFKSETDNEFNKKNLILIQNSDNIKWVISWEKNYIFYKSQTKKGDNLRNLFISILEKNN